MYKKKKQKKRELTQWNKKNVNFIIINKGN